MIKTDPVLNLETSSQYNHLKIGLINRDMQFLAERSAFGNLCNWPKNLLVSEKYN